MKIYNIMKYSFKFYLVFIFIFFFCLQNALSKGKKKKKVKKNKTSIPKVPRKIKFEGMKLYLTKEARSKVKDKVEDLMWNHSNMVDQANLFFPIFEQIFKEEKLPDSLKYLAILESQLVTNCVSSTKDYGIWAFQHRTALEQGMTINDSIDERFNVISSTRAMAKYMKKNRGHFNNWIHTIIAYNRGVTGAKNLIKKQKKKFRKIYRGNSMKLGGDTPNYIIKFLAYKIAFQSYVGKKKHSKYKFKVHEMDAGNSLQDVSEKFNVPIELLRQYNYWLKTKKVPEGRTYKALVPISHSLGYSSGPDNELSSVKNVDQNFVEFSEKKFPIIQSISKNKLAQISYINGLRGIIVKKDNISLKQIANLGSIGLELFLKYNEISKNHKVKMGNIYYFEEKRNRVSAKFHVVKKGETWWTIAQKYGILKSTLIYRNNRSYEYNSEKIKSKRILWLKYIRSKKEPVKFQK